MIARYGFRLALAALVIGCAPPGGDNAPEEEEAEPGPVTPAQLDLARERDSLRIVLESLRVSLSSISRNYQATTADRLPSQSVTGDTVGGPYAGDDASWISFLPDVVRADPAAVLELVINAAFLEADLNEAELESVAESEISQVIEHCGAPRSVSGQFSGRVWIDGVLSKDVPKLLDAKVALILLMDPQTGLPKKGGDGKIRDVNWFHFGSLPDSGLFQVYVKDKRVVGSPLALLRKPGNLSNPADRCIDPGEFRLPVYQEH